MAERNTALMHGFIHAVADSNNPAQTRLSLILTDFAPNNNKQAIPKTEAENILRTAVTAPLKINFDGRAYAGHTGAIPIGAIREPFLSDDNGREVIMAEAVVWNDIYPDISEHLKKAFASGVGTSWEIYFKDSQRDDNGVDWLQDCVFAGTCVVDVPAYGPNRTRVLAIAESLEHQLEIQQMAENEATAETDVDSLRSDIGSAMTVLSDLYDGFYRMLDQSYEIEEKLTTDDMGAVAEQFSKLVASITDKFEKLTAKVANAEQTETELTNLKNSIAEQEQQKAEAEKLSTRTDKLATAGLELTDENKDFYMSLDDTTFERYVSDLASVRNKATAEVKPNNKEQVIPEPTSGNTVAVSTKDLAGYILADINK